jgi:hypothetical protein
MLIRILLGSTVGAAAPRYRVDQQMEVVAGGVPRHRLLAACEVTRLRPTQGSVDMFMISCHRMSNMVVRLDVEAKFGTL